MTTNRFTSWNQGALYKGSGKTRFRVWAPDAERMDVVLWPNHSPTDRVHVTLQPDDWGYFEGDADAEPGWRYLYAINGTEERPDPASRSQPDGVHGASAVIDRSFGWTDGDWKGVPLEDYIIYELHVGTFTEAGTFDEAISRLPYLKNLGITAIEIMPVAQFPGARNWGYDGTYPYAAQNSYGGMDGFRRLVNAAHEHGLAVILDVVYNHLGPEGNYLPRFGPYFTEQYKTPWGWSLNYDGAWSDEVRAYFIGNALFWIEDCHVDALRLDAVHAIVDTSSNPFLRELTAAVGDRAHKVGRQIPVIAENDMNDAACVRPGRDGGLGVHSQWSDDFHHALHTVLTGELHGYYADFGLMDQLARAIQNGYVYDGEYSLFRQRRHGTDGSVLSGMQLVTCCQNHDQIGNRMLGDRLSAMVSGEQLKVAAAVLLMTPSIPLLFMGEEYGESAPFLYFTSHSDTGLIDAVRKGRREEFAAFFEQGEAPDPQSEDTFRRSRLTWTALSSEQEELANWYKSLLALRRKVALKEFSKKNTTAYASEGDRTLWILRRSEIDPSQVVVSAFNFSAMPQDITLPFLLSEWSILLASSKDNWNDRIIVPRENFRPYKVTIQLPSFGVLIASCACRSQE